MDIPIYGLSKTFLTSFTTLIYVLWNSASLSTSTGFHTDVYSAVGPLRSQPLRSPQIIYDMASLALM